MHKCKGNSVNSRSSKQPRWLDQVQRLSVDLWHTECEYLSPSEPSIVDIGIGRQIRLLSLSTRIAAKIWSQIRTSHLLASSTPHPVS